MEKLKNLISPGQSADDQKLYGDSTKTSRPHDGVLTGQGSHLASANKSATRASSDMPGSWDNEFETPGVNTDTHGYADTAKPSADTSGTSNVASSYFQTSSAGLGSTRAPATSSTSSTATYPPTVTSGTGLVSDDRAHPTGSTESTGYSATANPQTSSTSHAHLPNHEASAIGSSSYDNSRPIGTALSTGPSHSTNQPSGLSGGLIGGSSSYDYTSSTITPSGSDLGRDTISGTGPVTSSGPYTAGTSSRVPNSTTATTAPYDGANYSSRPLSTQNYTSPLAHSGDSKPSSVLNDDASVASIKSGHVGTLGSSAVTEDAIRTGHSQNDRTESSRAALSSNPVVDATSTILPDRTSTAPGTGASINPPYTARSFALGDSSAPVSHSSTTANKLDPRMAASSTLPTESTMHNSMPGAATENPDATGAYGTGATSVSGVPYTTKVSAPFRSDPISTAPLEGPGAPSTGQSSTRDVTASTAEPGITGTTAHKVSHGSQTQSRHDASTSLSGSTSGSRDVHGQQYDSTNTATLSKPSGTTSQSHTRPSASTEKRQKDDSAISGSPQDAGYRDSSSDNHSGKGSDLVGAGVAGGAILGSKGPLEGQVVDTTNTGPASSTVGPHKSNIANILDPRVQPVPAQMHEHRTVGPHQSDLLNKIDPRVVSDPQKAAEKEKPYSGGSMLSSGGNLAQPATADTRGGPGTVTSAEDSVSSSHPRGQTADTTSLGSESGSSHVSKKQQHESSSRTPAEGTKSSNSGDTQESHKHSLKDMLLPSSKEKTTAMTGNPARDEHHDKIFESASTRKLPESSHSHGRDAVVGASAAGAGGVGAYEAQKHLGPDHKPGAMGGSQTGSQAPSAQQSHETPSYSTSDKVVSSGTGEMPPAGKGYDGYANDSGLARGGSLNAHPKDSPSERSSLTATTAGAGAGGLAAHAYSNSSTGHSDAMPSTAQTTQSGLSNMSSAPPQTRLSNRGETSNDSSRDNQYSHLKDGTPSGILRSDDTRQGPGGSAMGISTSDRDTLGQNITAATTGAGASLPASHERHSVKSSEYQSSDAAYSKSSSVPGPLQQSSPASSQVHSSGTNTASTYSTPASKEQYYGQKVSEAPMRAGTSAHTGTEPEIGQDKTPFRHSKPTIDTSSGQTKPFDNSSHTGTQKVAGLTSSVSQHQPKSTTYRDLTHKTNPIMYDGVAAAGTIASSSPTQSHGASGNLSQNLTGGSHLNPSTASGHGLPTQYGSSDNRANVEGMSGSNTSASAGGIAGAPPGSQVDTDGSAATSNVEQGSSHTRHGSDGKKEGFIHRLLHRHEGQDKAEKAAGHEPNKLQKHH